eukprot:352820-Chlamydomonas_euryale.AAC.3
MHTTACQCMPPHVTMCHPVLQVSALVAAEAPAQWLAALLSRLQRCGGGDAGGLSGAGRITDVATALAQHGRPAARLMEQVWGHTFVCGVLHGWRAAGREGGEEARAREGGGMLQGGKARQASRHQFKHAWLR